MFVFHTDSSAGLIYITRQLVNDVQHGAKFDMCAIFNLKCFTEPIFADQGFSISLPYSIETFLRA